MSADERSAGPAIADWAVRGRPIPGETASGDLHVAAAFAGGALFAVIDGLGHGPEAAAASRVAAAVLEEAPARPVLSHIRECHEAMRGTRGAVISLASIDARRSELSWAGVGNVEAVLVRAERGRKPSRERILLRSGVVGYQLPPLRASETPIFAGDTLVMASDGLLHDFAEELPADGEDAAAFAEHLLGKFARRSDDALVLVARYAGAAP